MTGFVPDPSRTGGTIAVAFGALALWLVADAGTQTQVLAVGVAGVAGFAAGGRALRRGHLVGVLAVIGGGAALALSFALATARLAEIARRMELLPGLVGLWVLAAALIPLRRGWERPLVTAGTGLVFVSVLVASVVQGASFLSVLFAGTLTILAWDAAEHAVSVGGQVGAAGRTVGADLAHVGTTAAVGTVAVGLAIGVTRLGVEGLPFGGLVALLVAAVVLALGLHR